MQRIIGAAIMSLGLFSTSTQAADATPPATTYTIGAGIAVVPEYSGSDNYRALPLLVVDYQNANGFFASSGAGIGYKTKAGAFGLSAALGYGGYRDDQRRRMRPGSDDLRGMGEIRGSAIANLGASYEFDNGIALGVKAALALTHRDKGNQYQFGMLAPVLKTEQDRISVFTFADYSDGKNMQTYYGVTQQQSINTGHRFQPYYAKAGFTKVGAGVNWNRKLSERWSVNSSLGLTQLVGDAADSPLTKKKTAGLFATSFNYSFR